MAIVSIQYNAQTLIEKRWTDMKSVVAMKGLSYQYETDGSVYYIFALDTNITYTCKIYTGTVPDPANYSQAQNNTDLTDWTTNYMPGANNRNIDATFIYGTGTAGTPNNTVVTVQGITGGTPLPITMSNVDKTASGTITSTQNVAVNSQGASSVSCGITGTWTGTIVFEASVDGTNWVSASGINSSTNAISTSTTANGVFEFTVGGYQQLRARGNTVATGTATIALDSSTGVQNIGINTPLPAGSNVIGGVTGSGNFNIIGTGTAGSAATGVVTVQGISGGTNLPVSVSTALPTGANTIGAVTISGTPSVSISSALPTGANTIGAVTISGTPSVSLSGTSVITGSGTAGTPATGVISVQGISGGTALPVALSSTDRTASGTITTTQNVAINTQGCSSVSCGITGVWTGTIVFEATVDGTNWISISGANASTNAIVSSTTANGTFEFSIGGYLQLRVRGNTVATGTATIALDSSTGINNVGINLPLPAGSNVIGGVTGSGNFNVIGTGSAGVPASGVVSIQGVSGGTAVPVSVSSVSTIASSSTLNSNGANASIALAGQASVGMQLAAGTLIGTIVAQISYDGGTTWNNTLFEVVSTGTKVSSYVFASANPATYATIVTAGGISHARVIVTAYTSGTALVTLNASSVRDHSLLSEGTAASATPPTALYVGGTDGTNLRPLSTDSTGRLIIAGASTSATVSGFSFGYINLNATTANRVLATTYTEPSSNAQRSIASANTNDSSAGTGARTVVITYYTSTFTGPFTETVTMNGTTAVNTVSTTICYIESIKVATVGSNSSNLGVITLYASTGGSGGAVGTIAAAANTTFWDHHYVATGRNCYITGQSASNTANQPCSFYITAQNLATANSADVIVSDYVRPLEFNNGSGTFSRTYGTPIKIVGPARVSGWVLPDQGGAANFYHSFDYYDQ